MKDRRPVYFSWLSYEPKVLWVFIEFCMEHGTNKIFLVCWVICQHWLVCQWLLTPEVYHGYVDLLRLLLNFKSCMHFFFYIFAIQAVPVYITDIFNVSGKCLAHFSSIIHHFSINRWMALLQLPKEVLVVMCNIGWVMDWFWYHLIVMCLYSHKL